MKHLPLVLLAVFPLAFMGCKAAPKEPAKNPKPVKKKAPKSEAEPDDGIPPGHVKINKRKVDLSTEILPDFARQAGIRIRYEGEPHVASLQLFQPTPWRDALDILCQFSKLKKETTGSGEILLTAKGVRKIRGGAAGAGGGGGLGSAKVVSRGEAVDLRKFMKSGEAAVVEFTADW